MICEEIVLQLVSPFVTPWQADTLLGHIAWSIRDEEGEAVLLDWLDRFRHGEPPVCLSDGWENGWLPRPLLPPVRHADRELTLEEAKLAKERKRLRRIRVEHYERQAWEEGDETAAGSDVVLIGTTHNTVSRISGSTLPEGGLYSLQEMILRDPSQRLSIYARYASLEDRERFIYHMRQLEKIGYGSRRTTGKGQFQIAALLDRTTWFAKLAEGSRAVMWLSHGVPSPNDPTRGFYHTATKFGRLGSGWGAVAPFKKPLVRLKPGAVFASGDYRGWAGKLVDGIAAEPGVVQFGFALTIPLRLEDSQLETLSVSDARSV